jgi:hypothetical protein
MDMRTALDVRDRFADGPAILDERLIFGDVARGDLVAERNIAD